jgi:hypothetical protein
MNEKTTSAPVALEEVWPTPAKQVVPVSWQSLNAAKFVALTGVFTVRAAGDAQVLLEGVSF